MIFSAKHPHNRWHINIQLKSSSLMILAEISPDLDNSRLLSEDIALSDVGLLNICLRIKWTVYVPFLPLVKE